MDFLKELLLYLNVVEIQYSFNLDYCEQAFSIPSPSLPREIICHVKHDTKSGCVNWQY